MVLPVAAIAGAGTASAGKGVSLATVANVASVAGAAIGAVGALSSGAAARRQGDLQSEVLRQQAERERLDAAARERDFRSQQSRLMARRRALLGASGVDPAAGSPLLTTEDMTGEAELQALRIRAGGETVSNRLQQQAVLERAKGRSEQSSGFFRAGASLLTGVGGAFGRKALLS